MYGRRIRKYKREECENLNDFFVEFFKNNNLTKRDYEVLMSIYKSKCLTTEIITDLYFKYTKGNMNSRCDIVARRRLKYLYDNYLVDRFQLDLEDMSGSTQTYYQLDTLGAKLIAGKLDIPMSELNWSKEANDNLLPYLEHCVELNSIYRDIFEQSQTKDFKIQDYLCENHFTCKMYDKIYKVCPDAQMEIIIDNIPKTILIEYDRVKATPAKYIKKHKNYMAFKASNEYLNYFDEYPIVLFVTQTWDRVLELKSIFDGVDRTDIRFLFTSKDLISKNFEKDIYIESHIGERVKI